MKKPAHRPAVERRLSPWRVLLAFIVISGIAYLSFVRGREWWEERSIVIQEPWFASYVDVTSTPHYAFEQLGATASPHVVLSFIVSSPSDSCTPTWGSYYSLDEAAVSLDLDRRIARLQQQGGNIAISFGGAFNDELSVKCTDEGALYRAYNSVIERYHVDTIDLDIEGDGLNDMEVIERRAKVIAQLQSNRRQEGKSLAVWFTLPVTPQGLTEVGTDAVASMLTQGVDIAGVNVMTMNFGESLGKGHSMFDGSKQALIETHRQLGILYQHAGLNLNPRTVWRKIGATPMIGQNDILDEVFTLEDAQKLNTFSKEKEMGRMSMWSANRDVPCGDNYVNLSVVSDSCSGVVSDKFAFANALQQEFTGSITQNSKIVTTEDDEPTVPITDDPERSPYQIWQENGAYLQGTKIVWHGNVYEAKWWTKGDLPDNPVLQSWETPWQLIGPVLEGEKPVPQPTLAPGTYQEWSGKEEYQAGDRILFNGVPFEAKWWNQGDSPAASVANSDNSPWHALTQQEIQLIIEGEDSVSAVISGTVTLAPTVRESAVTEE